MSSSRRFVHLRDRDVITVTQVFLYVLTRSNGGFKFA